MKTNKKVYTEKDIKPGFVYFSPFYLNDKYSKLYLNIILEEIDDNKVKTCWMFGEYHGKICYYFKVEILKPLNNDEIEEIK